MADERKVVPFKQQVRVSGDPSTGFRTPPHSLDCELAILGAIMVNNLAFTGVREHVNAEDFYDPLNASMFQEIDNLIRAGRVADHKTMLLAFSENERLRDSKVTPAEYLSNLCRSAESIVTAEGYALHLLDLSCKRQLARIGEELAEAALAPTTGIEWPELVLNARRGLDEVDQRIGAGGARLIGDYLEQIALEAETQDRFTSTGLTDLDTSIGGGLVGGRIYGIEAPGKHFKTGCMGTIMRHLIRHFVPFTYLAADREPAEVLRRIVAAELNTTSEALEHGSPYLAERVRALKDSFPTTARFEDCPSLTFGGLRRICARAVEAGSQGILLDYWQRVRNKPKRETASVAEGLEEVADWIKGFAREHGVWAILASQENRSGETLWSGGLGRACVWLGQLRMVQIEEPTGRVADCLWVEVAMNTHGRPGNIGSKDRPPWVIDDIGPVLKPYLNIPPTFL